MYVVTFNLSSIFEEDENITQIQFKVHETTTNLVANSTLLRLKPSKTFQAPRIQFGKSEWIDVTDEQFKISLPRRAPANFSFVGGIFGVLVLLIWRRGRRFQQ